MLKSQNYISTLVRFTLFLFILKPVIPYCNTVVLDNPSFNSTYRLINYLPEFAFTSFSTSVWTKIQERDAACDYWGEIIKINSNSSYVDSGSDATRAVFYYNWDPGRLGFELAFEYDTFGSSLVIRENYNLTDKVGTWMHIFFSVNYLAPAYAHVLYLAKTQQSLFPYLHSNYQYKGNKKMLVSNTYAHFTKPNSWPCWNGSVMDFVFIAGSSLSLEESIQLRNGLNSQYVILLNLNENQGQYVYDSLTSLKGGVLGTSSGDTKNDPVWGDGSTGLRFNNTSVLSMADLKDSISNDPWLSYMWIKILDNPPAFKSGIIFTWFNDNSTYLQIYLNNGTPRVWMKFYNQTSFDLGITLDLKK